MQAQFECHTGADEIAENTPKTYISHGRKREWAEVKSNEVAGKEKGVSVVQIQDGIAQALQHRIWPWRRDTHNVYQDCYWHLL